MEEELNIHPCAIFTIHPICLSCGFWPSLLLDDLDQIISSDLLFEFIVQSYSHPWLQSRELEKDNEQKLGFVNTRGSALMSQDSGALNHHWLRREEQQCLPTECILAASQLSHSVPAYRLWKTTVFQLPHDGGSQCKLAEELAFHRQVRKSLSICYCVVAKRMGFAAQIPECQW